jgi:ribosomal protein L37AE/L43A
MYPWVCGRCAREFTRANVQLLEVHHRDHNHDNNPPDGSNWELLCTYCHENEHRRYLDNAGGSASGGGQKAQGTYQPFADLGELLRKRPK